MVLTLNLFALSPSLGQIRAAPQTTTSDNTCPAAGEQIVHEGFWRKVVEDPVATFTGVLAFFTVLLVGVSAIQIRYLIKADQTGRLTAIAAKASADASVQAAFAAMKQAELAERTLVGLERPHLLLSKIVPEIRPAIDIEVSPKDALVSLPRVKFTVKNLGRSPGLLKTINYRIFTENGIPGDPEYFKGVHRAEERFVAPGKRGFEGQAAVERWLNVDQASEILNGQSKVFFVGFLEYTDLSGVVYKTGFGLVYVPRDDKFTSTGGRAYNYRM